MPPTSRNYRRKGHPAPQHVPPLPQRGQRDMTFVPQLRRRLDSPPERVVSLRYISPLPLASGLK